jgi:hypothetical protein
MEAGKLTGKGLAFAAAGALTGAIIWGALSMFTGWSLWLLAPVIGGAAGLGMGYGTQMRGRPSHGLGAAAFTVLAIFGARYFVESRALGTRLEQEAVQNMTAQIAQEMEKKDADVYNDAGEYKDEVKAKGRAAWAGVSGHDRRAYLEALRAQNGSPTAMGVFINFGLWGMICTALAAGAAFKSANMSLERALVMKGLATDTDALNVAASMRAAQAAREKARAEGAPQPGLAGGLSSTKMRVPGDPPQHKRSAA